MRILGIDPGLATVGLGYIDATSGYEMRAGEWLTLETKAGLDMGERLKEIYADLTEFLADIRPELVVIEKLFFATNQQTAFAVSQARGVILLAVAEASIPIIEPTPLQLKHCITGSGSADKKQVQEMLVRILKLSSIPQPDDAADALGLAVYGAMQGVRLVEKQ
jgi:crossover junction endodeoxyribonuclease RuvC